MRGTQGHKILRAFLVEVALYYERDTKCSEPNALNTLYSSPSAFAFLVEGALYYERDTKFQEPKCSQHSYSSPSDQIPAMTSSS